jgi:hypothetical protein
VRPPRNSDGIDGNWRGRQGHREWGEEGEQSGDEMEMDHAKADTTNDGGQQQ